MVQMVNGKPLSKYAAKKAARLEEQQDMPERKFKQVNTRPRPSEFSEVKIHKHGPVQGPVKAKQMNVKEIKIVDTESKKFSIIDLSPEEIIDHPNFEQILDQLFPDLAPLYGIFSTAVSEKAAVAEKDKPALYKAVQKELFVLAIGAVKQGMESGLSDEQIAISIQKTIMENGEAIISRLIQNFTNFTKVAQPQNDASVAASQNKATISETPVTPKENEMSEIAETVKATAAATADSAAQLMEATRQTIQNTIADGMSEASFARYKADDFFNQDLSDIARQTATMAVKGVVVGAGAYVGWTLGKMAYNAVSDRLSGGVTTAA